MDGVMCDESKDKLLDNELAHPPWTTASMLLSTSNVTPTHATVAATITAGEIAVAGYARQPLTGWSASALDGSFRAVSSAAPVTFLNTSGADTGTIYTWAYIDTATGHLIEAGRFDLPFVLPATTGSYTTTPFHRLTGM